MSRRVRILTVGFMVSMLSAAVAQAQVIERPPRVYRGLFGAGTSDPNRWRHSVTLNGNAFGGFDDNLNPTAGDNPGATGNTPGTRGYMGFGGAQLQYSSTRGTKAIEFAGRGTSNGFRGLGLKPVFGGEASGRVSLPMGQRSSISAYERYSDNPLFAPSAPSSRSPLDEAFAPAALPIANTTSYLIRRSRTSDGSLTMQRRITRRTTLTGAAQHGRTRFDDGSGNSDTFGGMLGYGRSIGLRSMISAGYNFTSTETAAQNDQPARPLENHNLTFALSTNRRLTPSRQLAMSIGAGVTEVRTTSSLTGGPLSYRTPSGQASLRLDLTRSWNVAADYGRSVAVLEGVTLDSFITQNVSLRSGGQMWSRGDLAMTASWATGQAGPTGAGTYEALTGIVQVQVSANRWIDTMLSYTFYAYRLNGVTLITEGLATRLDRHAVRAGFVFNLPLYGSYVTARSNGGR